MAERPVQRILVLDDDNVMRDLLQALLSLEGLDVTLASSGVQALQTLEEAPAFDLVLTDVHMPGLEGDALARRLRAALTAETLLIGMSGSQPPESTRALFDAFVSKPFDTAALRQTMQKAEARRGARSVALPPQDAGTIEETPRSSTTKPTATRPAPLDETIFQALQKVIPAKQLGELFAMTLADISKRQQRIETAAQAGDLPTVQREAHSIKGSCGMVGASELQSLAAELEGGTTVDTSALAEIPAACLRLQRMLDRKLHTV